MRLRLAVLVVTFACGDSGGSTATTTTTDPQTTATTTGTSTSTTTGTTGDAPTGSGSAEASSGGASTGPDPTTGAVLTATGDMTTTTTADDTTSTGTTSTGTTSDSTTSTGTTGTPADDTTTSVLPECDGADVAAILDAFVECPSPGYFGQKQPISGVTCWDVCCAFGIINCGFRAAQADFDACNPMNAQPSGDCSDIFQMQWSSQCNCLN